MSLQINVPPTPLNPNPPSACPPYSLTGGAWAERRAGTCRCTARRGVRRCKQTAVKDKFAAGKKKTTQTPVFFTYLGSRITVGCHDDL